MFNSAHGFREKIGWWRNREKMHQKSIHCFCCSCFSRLLKLFWQRRVKTVHKYVNAKWFCGAVWEFMLVLFFLSCVFDKLKHEFSFDFNLLWLGFVPIFFLIDVGVYLIDNCFGSKGIPTTSMAFNRTQLQKSNPIEIPTKHCQLNRSVYQFCKYILAFHFDSIGGTWQPNHFSTISLKPASKWWLKFNGKAQIVSDTFSEIYLIHLWRWKTISEAA